MAYKYPEARNLLMEVFPEASKTSLNEWSHVLGDYLYRNSMETPCVVPLYLEDGYERFRQTDKSCSTVSDIIEFSEDDRTIRVVLFDNELYSDDPVKIKSHGLIEYLIRVDGKWIFDYDNQPSRRFVGSEHLQSIEAHRYLEEEVIFQGEHIGTVSEMAGRAQDGERYRLNFNRQFMGCLKTLWFSPVAARDALLAEALEQYHAKEANK